MKGEVEKTLKLYRKVDKLEIKNIKLSPLVEFALSYKAPSLIYVVYLQEKTPQVKRKAIMKKNI